ncbi:MAG: helix-turn-helix transcriptional regulator [Flavobacteriaceae bacterium]|nr:helix-turn-helix domain-containing protein [Bacteroidia bacterium]MBT8287513.1 helix-turn-helix domain-containing protein [Bacteroidia bacterium]NNF75326.1 helix-turn-helix transcriptional regulator [Flavobacteriaceae bacterium]NNK72079.1 helix-turn-helix transcriptional regulator [Flavobacteriaceae bacterium]
MINSDEFSERLKTIMDFHGLSASALSDRIGVQRSSISHILSGRNRPSLDFVMKVLDHFDDVDLYWLLNGKGSFPSSAESPAAKKSDVSPVTLPKDIQSSTKDIDRIVIFFKNGRFKSYSN